MTQREHEVLDVDCDTERHGDGKENHSMPATNNQSYSNSDNKGLLSPHHWALRKIVSLQISMGEPFHKLRRLKWEFCDRNTVKPVKAKNLGSDQIITFTPLIQRPAMKASNKYKPPIDSWDMVTILTVGSTSWGKWWELLLSTGRRTMVNHLLEWLIGEHMFENTETSACSFVLYRQSKKWLLIIQCPEPRAI